MAYSTSPTLSQLRHQNKSTRARSPASYADYFHISLFVYCFVVFLLSCIKANQNRDKTPWIVSLAHKVHFVSNPSMMKVFSNDCCETKIEAIASSSLVTIAVTGQFYFPFAPIVNVIYEKIRPNEDNLALKWTRRV